MTGLFAKYKEAVISLIIWAIVAIGCLLYFNFAHRPHRSPGTPPSTATTPSAASSPGAASTPSAASTDLDFSGYFVALDQLAGKLNEQQAFVQSLKGKQVRWRGYVSYVRNSDVSPSKIALAITPTPGDDSRVAVVYFGADLRERLFALREKDSVEITGTFDSESWNTTYIQGHTVQPLPSGAAAGPSSAKAAR